MPSTSTSKTAAPRPSFGRRLWTDASGGRRLLTAAAILHVALALGIHGAGRSEIAPGLIDGDGIMSSFAVDSYEYQSGATQLAAILKDNGVLAWAREQKPLHTKLLSILFVLFGPISGYGTLSAEPFNLICYLAVVGLTLLLGREVGGPRVGLFAAGAVALWPTLLLHTLQLLKDPLFIAGALALVLCVTTWITRTYKPAGAAGAVALIGVTTLLLLLIRPGFAVVILALVLLGAALLAVRQIMERRLLYWNMVAPCVILTAGALLLPLLLFSAPPPAQRLKQYPSDGGGELKTAFSAGERVATVVTYLPRAATDENGATSSVGRLVAAVDKAAYKVGTIRRRFSASYMEAGSGVDRSVRFDDLKSFILYLPRAFAIGFWSPFPDTWVAAGRRVGSAGKMLSGAETLAMYVIQLLALVAVLRPPRRLASWLLLAVTAFGVTGLGLVIPNIGALYRFRYTFWVLLLVLGAKGLESLFASRRQGFQQRAASQSG